MEDKKDIWEWSVLADVCSENVSNHGEGDDEEPRENEENLEPVQAKPKYDFLSGLDLDGFLKTYIYMLFQIR